MRRREDRLAELDGPDCRRCVELRASVGGGTWHTLDSDGEPVLDAGDGEYIANADNGSSGY
jgi:hypothetical protein